ncbi:MULTISPECIES: methyl-accepting chemotaxis protein [Thiomicrorhabdus]|uniref:Methyl-accepting chemotaxis protein n=1 Tax=Thiomicrorhabdus heinhorstiae TaxID=2748010 RepID=A0ABS0BWQ3_9GAMM|nr:MULTISPECIES: methyl-accepting chemotaxis protein [Thiomicrorhabdus]MBF6057246.1 methyl-accepting chemotaxis protein [Thiomicrorhabdus heinhorstiae]
MSKPITGKIANKYFYSYLLVSILVGVIGLFLIGATGSSQIVGVAVLVGFLAIFHWLSIELFLKPNVVEPFNQVLDITVKDSQELQKELAFVDSIKTVVDQDESNIMLADEDLNITYMNPSILKTLKKVEVDIQKMLPHFVADELIGKNIDIFHVNPAHQRKLLANLTETYTANLILGELHLRIIVNPLWGKDGKRDGFVTEWKDVSEQVKLEKMQRDVEENLKVMVERAAIGHLGEQIDVSALDGFIHDLGLQINNMSSAIQDANDNISAVVMRLSAGDLTSRVDGAYEGGLGAMKDAINTSMDNLSSILAQVNVAIEDIAKDTQATAQRNSDLSSRIQQQAASIEETAATMEEMTAAVRNNASNAQQANDLTISASQKTQQGAEVMKQTIEAMEQIKDSSAQIEQIIGLIDSIAFQTNLLALNAAVEAARAGEHGRGFAVVAGEVRALAGKSAEAAKDIKSLIDQSVDKIQLGTKLAQNSGESLSEINHAIQQVTEIVSEIAASSNEQAQGVEQLNQAIASLDQNTQENAILVEESAHSAAGIEQQSLELVDQMKNFEISSRYVEEVKGRRHQEKSPVELPRPKRIEVEEVPRIRTAKPAAASRSEVTDEWEEF